ISPTRRRSPRRDDARRRVGRAPRVGDVGPAGAPVPHRVLPPERAGDHREGPHARLQHHGRDRRTPVGDLLLRVRRPHDPRRALHRRVRRPARRLRRRARHGVRDRRDGARGGTTDATPAVRAVVVGLVRVLRNPHTWPPFLAFFCLYSAFGNLSLWIVPYLRDVYGLSARDAALYATAPSLALLGSAPLTGFVSDRVLGRRKLPYVALASCSFVLWLVLITTPGVLPRRGVYALFFPMGALSAAFVLTWPLGREVNPPRLAGIAVAVVNLGGFLGGALTQGALRAVLDARWTGVVSGGARVYPLEAYAGAFAACAALALAAALLSLLLRETRGRNVYADLRGGE